MRKINRIMTVLVALMMFSGCASISNTWTKLHQKRFKVDLSPLDYVQFSRRIGVQGGQPLEVHLELDGSGALECRIGRSIRVQNDFWQTPEGGDWRDLRCDRVVLTKEQTRDVYQRLVDAGVFDDIKPKKDIAKKDALVILAKMGFEKKAIVTDDPVFNKIFKELLHNFQGMLPQS